MDVREIEERLSEIVRKALETPAEARRTPRDSHVVWISELTWCPRLAFLARRRPRAFDVEGVAAARAGKAIHEVVEEALAKAAERVEREVPVSYTTGNGTLVKGRADAIVWIDDVPVLVEIKTASGTEPRIDFIEQACFYAAILDVPYAAVIVIDRGTMSYRVYAFRVDVNECLDELEKRARTLRRALEEEREPEPRKGPWCKWCPYRDECPAWRGRSRA